MVAAQDPFGTEIRPRLRHCSGAPSRAASGGSCHSAMPPPSGNGLPVPAQSPEGDEPRAPSSVFPARARNADTDNSVRVISIGWPIGGLPCKLWCPHRINCQPIREAPESHRKSRITRAGISASPGDRHDDAAAVSCVNLEDVWCFDRARRRELKLFGGSRGVFGRRGLSHQAVPFRHPMRPISTCGSQPADLNLPDLNLPISTCRSQPADSDLIEWL